MSCKHWNRQYLFCGKKQKTVSYDDLVDCTVTCKEYSPLTNAKTDNQMVCPNCCEEISVTKNSVVEINDIAHIKCPHCGSTIDIERNDKSLYDSFR